MARLPPVLMRYSEFFCGVYAFNGVVERDLAQVGGQGRPVAHGMTPDLGRG